MSIIFGAWRGREETQLGVCFRFAVRVDERDERSARRARRSS
jgi:hypothetical protein